MIAKTAPVPPVRWTLAGTSVRHSLGSQAVYARRSPVERGCERLATGDAIGSRDSREASLL
ncbi:MAG: hypothetical protein ACREOG_02785, partial [Gemmatimonadaceae bacterium]